jgi:hypothetical protein
VSPATAWAKIPFTLVPILVKTDYLLGSKLLCNIISLIFVLYYLRQGGSTIPPWFTQELDSEKRTCFALNWQKLAKIGRMSR